MEQPNLHYIMTRDGRKVTRENGVPSLVDIAVSLARTPRFAGNTSIFWSVLDHSLFVEQLAQREAEVLHFDVPMTRGLRLAALLHDAHEAMTGDIPTAFKTDDMRALQQRLDKQLMDEYFPGAWPGYDAWALSVKVFDREALLAEAITVGPFAYGTRNEVQKHFGDLPNAVDVQLLKDGLKNGYYSEQDRVPAEDSTNVTRFLRKYVELR